MPLNHLSLRGFRNLDDVYLDFSPGANYVFGPNAAGKTNLLEAVHYLAIGRSFRRSSDKELLGFGRDLLVVTGTDSRGRTGEIRYDGREKRVLLEGAQVERLSSFLGWLPVVVFLLDDIEFVRGTPALRRGFLDLAIAKFDSGYISVLNRYRQALKQHNRLLEQEAALDVRQAWEEELVRTGLLVYEHRYRFVGPLLVKAAEHSRSLAVSNCSFEFRPNVVWNAAADAAERFRVRLEETRRRAEELRQTVVGPHRDDIIVRGGERDLRRFGSVGEQRLAAIALRLAEADLLSTSRAERPVFLLDEIVSELDEERSRLVLDLVAGRGQVIYAAARRIKEEWPSGQAVQWVSDGQANRSGDAGISFEHFAGKVFHVQAGQVKEVR